jgi:Tfp pilus assembly protein PilX
MQKLKKDNQDGFASIVIALILITVLALLTVGFASLGRREQQDALDKQLAVQANYAAESGFNDVYNAVFNAKSVTSSDMVSEGGNIDPNQCLSSTYIQTITGSSTGNEINHTDGVGYTCVLLNLTPGQLTWNAIPAGQTENLTAQASGPIDTITIDWKSHDQHTAFRGGPMTFPPLSTWNPSAAQPNLDSPPVLQFSLTPLGSSFTRDSLTTGTYSTYLYPTGGGPSGTPTFGNELISSGGCNRVSGQGIYGGYDCSVTISGIPHDANNSYLIHLLNFYDTADVQVTGVTTNGGSSSPVNFVGQAVIDVTGQAHNVLKRIQVVASPQTGSSAEAIQAQNICKREWTAPTDNSYWPDGTEFINTSGAAVSGNDACYPED